MSQSTSPQQPPGNQDAARPLLQAVSLEDTYRRQSSVANSSFLEVDERGRNSSSVYGSMMVPRRLMSLARRFRNLPPGEQEIVVNACRKAVVTQQREYAMVRNQSFAWYATEPLIVNAGVRSPLARSPADYPDGSQRGSVLPPEPKDEATGTKFVTCDGSWQHLFLNIGERSYYIHLPSLFARVIMVAALWGFLVLSIGSPMLPGGWLFDPIACVLFSGTVGGMFSVLLHVPPLLGILWGAIYWGNINGRTLSKNIHEAVTGPVKAIALALILVRGGLSINIRLIRPMLWNVIFLSLLPLIVEAAADALVVYYIFDLRSVTWSLLAGFTIATISPNTVVDLLHLQSSGHGTYGGPTLLMLCAIPFDTAIGIWAVTFLQALALREGAAIPTLLVASAPLQFAGGICSGILLGVVLEWLTDLLYKDRGDGHSSPQGLRESDIVLQNDVRRRCFIVVIALAAVLMLACEQFELQGAGALCVVSLSATLSHRWGKRGEEGEAHMLSFSVNAAGLWNALAMPALFAFTGAMVDFGSIINADFLPHALVCVGVGIVCRCLGALVSSKGTDLTWRETVVLCLGWVGKASVQATLAVAIYDSAKNLLNKAAKGSPEEARYTCFLQRGMLITQLSVVVILIDSIVSVAAIRGLGRKWVRPDV